MSGAGSDRAGREIELRLDPARLVLVIVIVVLLGVAFVFLRAPGGRAAGKAGAAASGPVGSEDVTKDISIFDRGEEPGTRGSSGQVGSANPAGAGKAAPFTPPPVGAPASPASGVQPPTDSGVRLNDSGVRPTPDSGSRTPRASGAASTNPPTGWSVQVFSGDAAAAETLRRRLSEAGWSARAEPSGRGQARVRVGGYAARAEAERAARRLAATENLKPWVVSPAP